MSLFKLIHIDEQYRNPETVLAELKKNQMFLANGRHIDAAPREMMREIRKLDIRARVIIRNKHFPRNQHSVEIEKNEQYPFSFLYKNGGDKGIIDTFDALRQGNWFLCIDSTEVEKVPDSTEESEDFTRSMTHEYRYHVSLEDVFRWRTKSTPYVNLDRDPDSIGQSSWDGNLVSWFQSSFTTRIQYALKIGLFPEE
jgi:hypothetical protein